jgi:hypothetical protein
MSKLLPSIAIFLASAVGAVAAEAPNLPPDIKINQIQVLGTHNSYSAGVDPHLLALFQERIGTSFKPYIDRMPPDARALFHEEHPNDMSPAEMLKYSHPPLATQLDIGVRSLEIDINPDPKGGVYADPVGYRMLKAQGVTDLSPFDSTDLDKPGFKVLHIPDIDFRSNCPTLRLCLKQLRAWSDAHPGHIPLFILIEAKIQDVPILPGATHTVPFSPALFDDLDREFVEVMGRERIITPDDVRGDYPTLNAAIRAGHWPRLKDARGKVLFLIMTATGPSGAAGYLQGHPSLKGRIAFLRSEPGEDHAAFLLLDNALVRHDDIMKYVREGYLVRTRSDIETYEAKVNDLTRATAAFSSGAQMVSTDFERAPNAYGTPYVIRLPGDQVARCNPVLRPQCPTPSQR